MAIRHISNIAGYKFGCWRAVTRVPLPFCCYSVAKELDSAPAGALPHSGTAIAVPQKERQNQCPQH